MKIIPSEYEECLLLAQYLGLLKSGNRILAYTHIPNETFTKYWGVKIKNMRMGVQKGFPDYLVLHKNGVFVIEMKKQKGGSVSKHQKEWIRCFGVAGVPAKVCFGFDDAKIFIEEQVNERNIPL